MYFFIILSMIFLGIVDDFYLQGFLANAKQREWWLEDPKAIKARAMYKNDYVCALYIHAFSWSFMTMLPLAVYMGFDISLVFVICFSCNISIHAIVDDMKANRLKINLIQDQSIHLAQTIVTGMIVLADYLTSMEVCAL